MAVDPRAAAGFAADAETYERVRPSYPPAAIARLARELRLDAASTVLDVGAGTGKLTRLLVPITSRVIAVEPVDEMRAVLERVVPGVGTLAGSAERIPLPDGSVDAVVVGEAFHWFRVEEAAAERERSEVRLRVLELVRDEPEVELRYVTELYWSRKRDPTALR